MCRGAWAKGDLAKRGDGTEAGGREQNARGQRAAGAQVRRWRGKGAAPRDPVQGGGGGCVWVCPRRGVLREGLARGRARKLCSPEPNGGGGERTPSAWRGGGAGRLNAPGAGCSRDAAKERPA